MKSLFKVTSLVLCLALSGCAVTGLPANATVAQKMQADVDALKSVAADIKAQCPKLAPVAGLISKAIAVASDPYNVLQDVLSAMSAYSDLKQDYAAIKCAVDVVLSDLKKLKPSATVSAQIETLQNLLVILDTPGTPSLMCAAR